MQEGALGLMLVSSDLLTFYLGHYFYVPTTYVI